MILTKVSVSICRKEEYPVIAYANIVLNDSFAVHKIRILKTPEDKTLVLMPSIKGRSGNFDNVCYPVNNDLRLQIESAILGRVSECSDRK